MKRLHVYYSGRVQGVGFRYAVREAAQELRVGGWVRNLPDGRVELVAEGSDEVLDQLIWKVQQTMGRFIQQTQTEQSVATGEFSEFGIAR